MTSGGDAFELVTELRGMLAPLDSAGGAVPLANLPVEVGGAGPNGDGCPYVVLYQPDSLVTIATDTTTTVTGWDQVGTTSVTFEDGTNTRWQFPIPGLWSIECHTSWETNTTGSRAMGLGREAVITLTGSPPATSEASQFTTSLAAATAMSVFASTLGVPVLHGVATVRVTDWGYTYTGGALDYAADNWFSLKVRQSSGGNLYLSASGQPGGSNSHVVCTYLGVA